MTIQCRQKGYVHFSGVRFSTAVNFAEAASADYPMDAEIVHGQLQYKQIFVPRQASDGSAVDAHR